MKKRILQVCGQLSVGGQEMMVKNFYLYIDRSEFQFDYIVYGSNIGYYEKDLIELGANIYHVSFPTIKNLSKYKNEMLDIMRKGDYSGVHSHTYTNNGLVLELAKKASIPIRISHCHSTESGKKENVFYACYKKYMRHLILKNCTHMIACGIKAGQTFYGRRKFARNGIVIKNGIDLEKFNYNEKKRDILRDTFNFQNRLVLAHIGRFVDVKNHMFLIDVAYELMKFNLDFILLLIGDGELLKQVEEYVNEKHMSDQVRFLGNRSDINELLQEIDIILCPSKYEGVPVSLIEAQATGVTCFVSTHVSEEVNITKQVKFIDIKAGDEKKWVNEIINYTPNERNEANKIMSENGYDIRQSCKKLEHIYSGNFRSL